MKRTLVITFALLLLSIMVGLAQKVNPAYINLINDGWKLSLEKDFSGAVKCYEKAFKLHNNIPLKDRYNVSCMYALLGNNDMAFYHLFVTANDLKWGDYYHLINDTDLEKLHSDKRWEKLKTLILKNKQDMEAHFDKNLVKVLDQIYFDDQSTRNKIGAMEDKYGRKSKEMNDFWQTILKKDSINLIKVRKILDEKGWPSKKLIGERGTSTLFLVIQHANQEAQEKYLPLIKQAVADNNLPKRQYAMFYDRLLLRRGKRQIYGTQLAMNNESKTPYVLPLTDPLNVDFRRAEMGLNTMQENLKRWNLVWNVKTYLKELPAIEAKEKALNSKKM